MNMNYNTFKGLVLPYFLTRGADMSGGLQNIDNYIHLGFQAASLYTDWHFMKRYEIIESVKVGDKYICRTENEVYKINTIDNKIDQPLYINKDFKLKGDSQGTYLEFDTDILEIKIEYYVEYEWISIEHNGDNEIPFPNSFLPALTQLVFDAGSPLTAFEGDRTPRWQIAEKYLKRLSERNSEQYSGGIIFNTD